MCVEVVEVCDICLYPSEVFFRGKKAQLLFSFGTAGVCWE